MTCEQYVNCVLSCRPIGYVWYHRSWSTSTFPTVGPSWKTPRTSLSPNGHLTGSGRVRRESRLGLLRSPVCPTLQRLPWQPRWPSNSSQLQVWLPTSSRKFCSSHLSKYRRETGDKCNKMFGRGQDKRVFEMRQFWEWTGQKGTETMIKNNSKQKKKP